MNEKEKAIAYDKALERAKLAIKKCGNNKGRISMIESIFPELGDSEDERIRKGIIDFLWKEKIFLQEVHKSVENNPKYRFVMDAIAWLEKQKDTNVLIQEASEKAYTEGMRVERKHWIEKQGERQPAWTGEDEDNLRFVEHHFKTFLTNTYYDTFLNWLKSLRTRLGGSEHDNVTSKTTNVSNSSITVEGMYNPTKDASI